MDKPKTRVIASDKNWIEGEALRQLEHSAGLPGMKLAVGLPDLHPGKGHPIGAAFFSTERFYPYLVGNDIGCGMSLWSTGLQVRKLRRDRWVRRLDGLDSPWDGDAAQWLADHKVEPEGLDAYHRALGTIGGGNHFAELQMVKDIVDPEAAAELGLNKKYLVLTVHSGSRGLGHEILRQHIDAHRADSLDQESQEAETYLRRHDQAVAWAKANRALIAHRFTLAIGTEAQKLTDSAHNTVTSTQMDGVPGWLHRKGAAPADQGMQVIPGSRGALSYVVKPTGNTEASAHSLAHGAGRKWARSEARGKLGKVRREELTLTKLGSAVICEDKQLLYEEAPQAYKDITRVIADLVDAGLVDVVATLKPVITYKTRRR